MESKNVEIFSFFAVVFLPLLFLASSCSLPALEWSREIASQAETEE